MHRVAAPGADLVAGMKGASYKTDRYRKHTSCGVNRTVATALLVARRYGKHQPTVAQLQADFCMSRATAFRWRAAWQYVFDAELSEAEAVPRQGATARAPEHAHG